MEGGGAQPGQDLVLPFQTEASNLRGRLVRLAGPVDEILNMHDYPEPVCRVLAESLVVTSMLASLLKFDGSFSLQARGDGPISLMVTEVSPEGSLRGYARFDAEAVAASGGTTRALLGQGHLAFTVDQAGNGQNYQGIVTLEGDSVADHVRHYFQQSEQLDTGLVVAVDKDETGWRAGGLLLQRQPAEESEAEKKRGAAPRSTEEDAWRHAMLLMGTATQAELLGPEPGPADLLWRLFHEDGVRVFDARLMKRGCSCSAARALRVLRALPRADIEDLMQDERLEITCEFCNARYAITSAELDAPEEEP